MKHFATVASAALIGMSFAGIAHAAGMSKDAQITQAVSALPAALRAGATVISYSPKGEPMVLRQGSNDVICNPNPANGKGFRVVCYGKSLEQQMNMQAKLAAEGKDMKAVRAAIADARKSGKLPTPPMGTTIYVHSGKTEAAAHELWVVLMPNAKAEDLGLPTKRGNGSPWMMLSGTPNAHIMIPQTASMNTAANMSSHKM